MCTSHQQLAIEKTMEVGKYMKASFLRSLHRTNVQVEIPDHWSLEFTQDCNYMVHLLVKAVRNPGIPSYHQCHAESDWRFPTVSMSWSVVDYAAALCKKGTRCTGCQAHIEKALLVQFPPLARTSQEVRPCIILDNEGRILMWYLPGIISLTHQVSWILMGKCFGNNYWPCPKALYLGFDTYIGKTTENDHWR